jgi:hypothetical protein
MRIIDECPHLLHVCVLMSDYVDNPVLDVGIEVLDRA